MQGAVMEGTPVTEDDLKLISSFGSLVTDRRPGQTLCHKVGQQTSWRSMLITLQKPWLECSCFV